MTTAVFSLLAGAGFVSVLVMAGSDYRLRVRVLYAVASALMFTSGGLHLAGAL